MPVLALLKCFNPDINWTSPFPILGLLGGIFHFYSSLNRNVCKHTVETLIRHRVLGHLSWFCTICRCPTKRTPGLYGLNFGQFSFQFPGAKYVRLKCVPQAANDDSTTEDLSSIPAPPVRSAFDLLMQGRRQTLSLPKKKVTRYY